MIIWFLHNIYGLRNRVITFRSLKRYKPLNYKQLDSLSPLGKVIYGFCIKHHLLYKSSTGLLTPLPHRLRP